MKAESLFNDDSVCLDFSVSIKDGEMGQEIFSYKKKNVYEKDLKDFIDQLKIIISDLKKRKEFRSGMF